MLWMDRDLDEHHVHDHQQQHLPNTHGSPPSGSGGSGSGSGSGSNPRASRMENGLGTPISMGHAHQNGGPIYATTSNNPAHQQHPSSGTPTTATNSMAMESSGSPSGCASSGLDMAPPLQDLVGGGGDSNSGSSLHHTMPAIDHHLAMDTHHLDHLDEGTPPNGGIPVGVSTPGQPVCPPPGGSQYGCYEQNIYHDVLGGSHHNTLASHHGLIMGDPGGGSLMGPGGGADSPAHSHCIDDYDGRVYHHPHHSHMVTDMKLPAIGSTGNGGHGGGPGGGKLGKPGSYLRAYALKFGLNDRGCYLALGLAVLAFLLLIIIIAMGATRPGEI